MAKPPPVLKFEFPELASIATKVRKRYLRREGLICVRDKCEDISDELYQKLLDHGFNPSQAFGDFLHGGKARPHTWVELIGERGRTIIMDATADQFSKDYPKVWVDAPKQHYRKIRNFFN